MFQKGLFGLLVLGCVAFGINAKDEPTWQVTPKFKINLLYTHSFVQTYLRVELSVGYLVKSNTHRDNSI